MTTTDPCAIPRLPYWSMKSQQRVADPGPAGPVGHRGQRAPERQVRTAEPQCRGQGGQAGAEDEHLGIGLGCGTPEQVQVGAGVGLHRGPRCPATPQAVAACAAGTCVGTSTGLPRTACCASGLRAHPAGRPRGDRWRRRLSRVGMTVRRRWSNGAKARSSSSPSCPKSAWVSRSSLLAIARSACLVEARSSPAADETRGRDPTRAGGRAPRLARERSGGRLVPGGSGAD